MLTSAGSTAVQLPPPPQVLHLYILAGPLLAKQTSKADQGAAAWLTCTAHLRNINVKMNVRCFQTVDLML